jgi:hypothetical protein
VRTYKQAVKDLTTLLDVAQKEIKRLQAVSIKQSENLAKAMYETNQALAAVSAHRTRIVQETQRADDACQRNAQLLGLNTMLNNRVMELRQQLAEAKKPAVTKVLLPKFRAGDVVKIAQNGKLYGYQEIETYAILNDEITYNFVTPYGYKGFSYNGTAERFCTLVASAEPPLEDEGDE